ncbi:MAG: aminoacetone oxidase family FAD-binding enzyme [Peptoniphilaceae bacterium]|nr:aminoacetone oxidase family FAD-binding enzyme [Peptoniphilaceae bacterium]MDD7383829.1 aminoacetone oxidase family FAD-binding enzyme [Peptoniphilaceae bacterium]MDY3737594.1 aminoacetone oxidase family FAD-binding enzyme [Peptoniphilaceae bacterium]
MQRIAVIGLGASGLAFCSMLNYPKIAIEKNDFAGRKLLATGNGRCNFTNKNLSYKNYTSKDSNFCKKALSKFSLKEILSYFKKIGIDYVMLESGRYYPKTMSAKTVQSVLLEEAKKKSKFLFNKEVKDIDFLNKEIICKDEKISYDYLVLSFGGKTLKKSGSDGKIFEILKKNKIKIEKFLPGIINFDTKIKPTKLMKGTKVKAKLTLTVDGKLVKYSTEDVLFQDYGISGTAVFNISNEAVINLENNKKCVCYIDFCYDYEYEKLVSELKRRKKLFKNRNINDFLLGLVHEKLISEIIYRSLRKKVKIEDLSDKEIEKIAKTLKFFEYELISPHSFDSAQVTIGGVSCDEIDPETMRLKRFDGVYIIGEAIDVSGDCGGYNLQRAFTSAFSAYSNLKEILCLK